jgi:hypothetical protein
MKLTSKPRLSSSWFATEADSNLREQSAKCVENLGDFFGPDCAQLSHDQRRVNREQLRRFHCGTPWESAVDAVARVDNDFAAPRQVRRDRGENEILLLCVEIIW